MLSESLHLQPKEQWEVMEFFPVGEECDQGRLQEVLCCGILYDIGDIRNWPQRSQLIGIAMAEAA